MINSKFIASFVVGFLFVNLAFAQRNFEFKSINAKEQILVDRLFSNAKKYAATIDTFSVFSLIRSAQNDLYADGFLAARVDSVIGNSANSIVWFTVGEQYKLLALTTDKTDDQILSAAGVKTRLLLKKPFSPNSYKRLSASILKYCSNNGYPFALVKLDSVQINSNSIQASLVIDKGPLVIMDSALVRGNARLSETYLFNYLGLRAGIPYNDDALAKLPLRIKELPFVTEGRPAEVEFTTGKARPVFYLQPRKASQFNGVLGVQPDNADASKVNITADIKLRLHNAFGRAELFDFNWTNPQPRTQDLKVKFSYPFILGLPFGIDLDLTLFKRDSLFLEINRQVGFKYLMSGNNSFRVFAGNKTSNLISTKGYQNVTTLPTFADVSTNNYGMGLNIEHVDYRLNPRKGYAIELTTTAGFRTIKKNSKINSDVYDSLSLKTIQYKAEFAGDIYLPVGVRSVLDIGSIAGIIESPSLFQNELFRIGGLKTLRGFDELTLLASTYIIGKMEYRFILEQNSYLLLFYNQAYIEDRSNDKLRTDSPYGFGAGITFETKIGIFSFNYALGSQQNNPILFRAAKIHFGLLNYF